MELGELGRLGPPGIDHDDRSRGILGDVPERQPRVRDAVRLPRVLPNEERHLAMLEIAADRGAEHEAVDQDLAGLLLRDRAGTELGAKRPQGRVAVGAAEMVPLASTALVEDRLAAEPVAARAEPRGDLGDRGLPVDGLEGAVLSPAERMEDALAAAVLVVVEAEGLLARVALGGRVGLVPADLLEAAPVGAAQLDEDPAVALAEDAGGRLPLRAVGLGGRFPLRAIGLGIGAHVRSPAEVGARHCTPLPAVSRLI